MEPDDLVLFVNTFSKNWAMTGWRIGWISAPPALGKEIENLIQYSTSGVARSCSAPGSSRWSSGEDFVARQVERARAESREIVAAGSARPLRSQGRTGPSICVHCRRRARPVASRSG